MTGVARELPRPLLFWPQPEFSLPIFRQGKGSRILAAKARGQLSTSPRDSFVRFMIKTQVEVRVKAFMH